MRLKRECNLLVVGAGPAGIAAATTAAACGLRTIVVDDNPSLGGQIWRAAMPDSWSGQVRRLKIDWILEARVIAAPAPGLLLAESASDSIAIAFQKLILATGARERFLPFPGWTLPNVTGAGGLQALVKGGLPIAGKRVVVAGSGPLLLAVADFLRKRGAHILMVAEQADWRRLARFTGSLARSPRKLIEAARLSWGLAYRTSTWPVAASGDGKLERVTLESRGRRIELACDYLACGFGLTPNLELPLLLGCRVVDGFVAVDAYQQTSLAGVWCAGEPTGIAGLEAALAQGRIAGYAAAGRMEEARRWFAARDAGRRFQRQMEAAFALREELRALPSPSTLVCRCEDVSLERLGPFTSWRSAKLQTRCGMGPCQGRVCGPAVEFLFGWRMESVRPPIFPARVESL